MKSLSFNAGSISQAASAVLLDTRDSPVALRIERSSAPDEQPIRTVRPSALSLAPQWVWRLDQGAMPNLPARCERILEVESTGERR